jgi:hypothetical protein
MGSGGTNHGANKLEEMDAMEWMFYRYEVFFLHQFIIFLSIDMSPSQSIEQHQMVYARVDEVFLTLLISFIFPMV